MGTISLRRLLNRRNVSRLFGSFLPLLPETTLLLLEANGRTFVEVSSVPAAPQETRASAPVLRFPLILGDRTLGALVGRGSGVQREQAEIVLQSLHKSLILLLARSEESRSLAQETLERYREINLLYNIGETISASLDPEEIPHLVLAEAGRIIQANVGSLLLLNEAEELEEQVGFGKVEHQALLVVQVKAHAAAVTLAGQPCIFTAEQLTGDSHGLETLLCTPLKTRERVLGLIVLGRLQGGTIFTAGDQKLLLALAGQAAIAMENARLFADIKQQRDAIAEMKNYMDNIFASIASGVITTDIEDLVTILNRAAEHILGVSAKETMGQPFMVALPTVGAEIASLVAGVKQADQPVFGYEMRPVLSQRGPVDLRVHLSPLKDNHQQTTGIAIVLDDLTEQRQLEAQVRQVRSTFERYVAPQVVEQLLSDPAQVELGGVRQEVTILFADVRGFTAFSQHLNPNVTVDVLNRHLTLAAEAILKEAGTLDKFVGDAVMAIFNAPLSQPDHTLRAVRAAWRMQQAIAELHTHISSEQWLGFGLGIVTGLAVVGNVGSPALQNYTAIGDSVNLASRLQSYASAGQILLDTLAYAQVRDYVEARELGYVQFKGHSEPDLVFEILDLHE